MSLPRNKLERLRDQELIAELYMQGLSSYRIAEKLNMNRSTVRSDIDTIEERWKAQLVERMDVIKARQLAKLEYVWRTTWDAWQRSSKGRQRTLQEILQPSFGGQKTKSSVIKEESAGDARLLAILVAIHDRICRLYGLEAGQRLQLLGPGGGPIQIEESQPNLNALSLDELTNLRAIVSKAQGQVALATRN